MSQHTNIRSKSGENYNRNKSLKGLVMGEAKNCYKRT